MRSPSANEELLFVKREIPAVHECEPVRRGDVQPQLKDLLPNRGYKRDCSDP